MTATADPERRPRIAFVATQSGSGGVRELWTNLADGFAREGHEVRLAALYGSPLDAADVAPPPWRLIVARRPRDPLGALRMARALGGWLRRERPDVVFTAQPVANVLVPLFARLSSPATRVVVTHHSPVGTHHPAVNAVDGLSGRLGNVAGILSVSDAVSLSLAGKSAAYRAKRVTVRNALPPQLAARLGAIRSARGPRSPAARRLVTTGRLAGQKNYPLLLRAMALLPDVSLDIHGSGPDEAMLRAMVATLGVAPRVRFHGARARDELMPLLADGSVFVQVSLFEGHSLALVEAATLGLPLIVSAVPEQIEAVTLPDGARCARTVPVDDPEALARAVRSLLDDPDAYRDACVDSVRLAECWTFTDMLGAYRRLVEAPGHAGGTALIPPAATGSVA
jgi:glycosyltransferase involved in cell wall biosynthesis